jgi:hypothetical protein
LSYDPDEIERGQDSSNPWKPENLDRVKTVGRVREAIDYFLRFPKHTEESDQDVLFISYHLA